MKKRKVILLALFFALILGVTTVMADDPPEAPEPDWETLGYVPGELLVKFKPGASRAEIAQQNGARTKEGLRAERVWVLEVDEGEELEVATNLRMNPNVEFAEPNYIYSIIPCETGDCTAPDDLLFGAKWDLHNPGYVTDQFGNVVAQTGQEGADIAWLEAYNYLESNGGVTGTAVIGVIDTGIRATHQDLAGKVIGGRNFCPSLFCLIGTINPNNWADDNGHGTHVAGIAGAHGNNGLGTPGVAYAEDIKFLAVRVCGGPLGLCNAAGITNGIIWAVDNGANVLNLSLGGGAPSTATQNALQYALDNNVLPVCASGNDGAATVSYPAAFPQCMAVGSSNWSDERSSYSNYGPEVEVVAPGGDISEDQPHSFILASYHSNDTAYAYLAGTSMATPQVAGLAALLYANGMTSTSEIRQQIRNTADDLGPDGFDNETGFGRVNVYRALTYQDPFIEMRLATQPVIKYNANGNVKVLVFDREAVTFSLSDVQIDSIRLGNTPVAVRPNGTPFATWTPGGNGGMNLVLHFSLPELRNNGDLTPDTTEMTLFATLEDGRSLRAFVDVIVR